jgi:hypothetical protein
MTSPVLAALANARAAEIANEERILTAGVWKHLGLAPLQGDRAQWSVWQQWCDQRKITAFPALPAALAVFVLNNEALGDRLEAVIESISAVHQADGKADPTLSPVVIAALFPKGAPREPPRSWDKAHKIMWQILPRAIQEYIVKRQDDHDKEIHRLQREYAQLRKDLINAHPIKESPAAAGTDRIDAGGSREAAA